MKEKRDLSKFDYADPRAKKFVRYFHDGEPYFENDHKDLIPTKTIAIGHYDYCVYCSNQALSIQSNIPFSYEITGKTCICKGAMDEIEMKQKIKSIKDELQAFKNDTENKIKQIEKQHYIDNPDTAEELVKRIKDKSLSKITTIQELQEFCSRI